MNTWDIFWLIIDKPIGFGIDWLFYGWVLVTVLLFIDLFLPDPIPFIDEILLGILFFAGIVLLGTRRIRESAGGITEFFESPLILAFAITLVVLFVGSKIYDYLPQKKGRKRK